MTVPTTRAERDNAAIPPRVAVVMPGDLPALMSAMTAGTRAPVKWFAGRDKPG